MKCCRLKSGVIIEIQESSNKEYQYITIAQDPKDIYTYIRLVTTNQTLIVDSEYNEISLDDLEIGSSIIVYHSNIMTMSIPPQTTAYIIELKW